MLAVGDVIAEIVACQMIVEGNNLFGMFLDGNQKTLDQTCEMTADANRHLLCHIELLRANPAVIPARAPMNEDGCGGIPACRRPEDWRR
jgi:hypothetical protein